MENITLNINEVLKYLGGASLIIIALSSWLGKIWSNRIIQKEISELNKEIEKLKTKLKNSENMFSEQLSAAKEFGHFFATLSPEKEYHSQEYEDAIKYIDFEESKKFLKNFIAKYNMLFDDLIINKIQTSLDEIQNHDEAYQQFLEHSGHNYESGETALDWLSSHKWQYADKFYSKLNDANGVLKSFIENKSTS